MKLLQLLALFLLTAVPASTVAVTPLEASQTCLADNSSGKDRKVLARWIFVSISTHPEISNLSAATKADQEASSRALAALFTRLVTKDCATELRAMAQAGGSGSVEAAFEFLGGIAMKEIMMNDDVSASIADFEQYIDKEKMAAVLEPKKEASK